MIERRPWRVWTAHPGALPPCCAALVISLQEFCALTLSEPSPKRHRGWRKPQIKMLPFHMVSKRLVLKGSYEITQLLRGTACGDLPGEKCSCPTSETVKVPSPLILCWDRAKKKRNFFNSVFGTISSLFSAEQRLLRLFSV